MANAVKRTERRSSRVLIQSRMFRLRLAAWTKRPPRRDLDKSLTIALAL
jgi:hypothetical protein